MIWVIITWSDTWWQDNSPLGMQSCFDSWLWKVVYHQTLNNIVDLRYLRDTEGIQRKARPSYWPLKEIQICLLNKQSSLQNGFTLLLPSDLNIVIFYHKPVCHTIKAVIFHLRQRKVRLGFAVIPLSKHQQASHLHFSIWALLDHSTIEICSTPCP